MHLRGFNPATRMSLVPHGLGHVKPNHSWEMVRTIWKNRDNLGAAWRILRNGVCDGRTLGTTGLRDFTMDGIHRCTVRLNLLRLNTMPPLAIRRLDNGAGVRTRDGRRLRALGRLPYPMIRRRGDAGLQRISWNQALDIIADRIRVTDPRRIAFSLTSRGMTNEPYASRSSSQGANGLRYWRWSGCGLCLGAEKTRSQKNTRQSPSFQCTLC